MSCGKVDPDCRGCRLSRSRSKVVAGDGDCASALIFVGEAPGKNEDLEGRPFVGMAGRLLDSALLAAGASREQVYITNIVKCRPPGNRRPKADEICACSKHLQSEFEGARPRVVVALGQTAAKSLFGPKGKMADMVGRSFDAELFGRSVKAMVVYHPAACLYRRDKLPRFNRDVKRAVGLAGRPEKRK